MRPWRRQACAARAGGTGRTRSAREGGGGTSCHGARAQSCARAPSPADAARAQQIHPRPRLVGQVRPRAGRACGRQCSCGEAEQHKHAATACAGAAADGKSASVVPKFGDGRKSRSSSASLESRGVPSCLVASRLRPTPLRRKLIICRAWPHLPEVTNQVLFDLNRHWYVMQLCNAAM